MFTLRYLYDENNSPVGFGLKYPSGTGWANYYFAKNLQGDVTAVYRSDAGGGSYTGTLVAKYSYDPFGQLLSVTNASGTAISQTAAHVANYNPFRYRGYYYDTESGFYYLQSRYYDPEICRFINADSYASTSQGFLGCNMFAYCNNNPICFEDADGEYAISTRQRLETDAGYGGGGGGIIIWGVVKTIKAVASAVQSGYRAIEAFAKEQYKEKKRVIDEIVERIARSTEGKQGVFYGADIQGGSWKTVTRGMSFSEAVVWVEGMSISHIYGRNASWGLYTLDPANAYQMATVLGGGPPIIDFGKPGQYDHFHTMTRELNFIYKHFHVWFGELK